MGFFVGVGDIARHLLGMLCGIAHERKDRQRRITVLWCQNAEIDCARINTRRRAGFQTADAQWQCTQTACQRNRRRIASTATAVIIQSDVNFAVKESPNGQDHRFCTKLETHLGYGTHNTIVFNDQIVDRLLEDHQVWLILQRGSDGLPIQDAIGLSTSCPHRGAFAGV